MKDHRSYLRKTLSVRLRYLEGKSSKLIGTETSTHENEISQISRLCRLKVSETHYFHGTIRHHLFSLECIIRLTRDHSPESLMLPKLQLLLWPTVRLSTSACPPFCPLALQNENTNYILTNSAFNVLIHQACQLQWYVAATWSRDHLAATRIHVPSCVCWYFVENVCHTPFVCTHCVLRHVFCGQHL